ncbi:MAG: hypothetical protein IIZ51_09910, partial [Lachnospiraceae bacterium]|nr:hypothetical protein [Lachnospiraceae bacterium]
MSEIKFDEVISKLEEIAEAKDQKLDNTDILSVIPAEQLNQNLLDDITEVLGDKGIELVRPTIDAFFRDEMDDLDPDENDLLDDDLDDDLDAEEDLDVDGASGDSRDADAVEILENIG